MTGHVVSTTNIFNSWRSWCGCGWVVYRKGEQVALRAAQRHLDSVQPAHSGRSGVDRWLI